MKKKVEEILDKYGKQLEGDVKDFNFRPWTNDYPREFIQFKKDMMPDLSKYEQRCKKLGSVIKLKLAEKDEVRISQVIQAARLDISPSQVVGMALMSAVLFFLLGIFISVMIYLIRFPNPFPFMFLFLMFLTAGFMFYYFYTAPGRFATKWKLKAGSQTIPCILYIVVYMKHTSNLERAVEFASQHLEAPLNFDFRKVFWDVETGKYSTIKASLEAYLETWRKESPEFVESFNLIESSLFEPSEARRVAILERSLQVILDGVYDKMLKYTYGVKAPLTNLYMFGITLPILALALLPLASVLLRGSIKWYHIMIVFNVLIPFFVFYKISELMSKRPGGYGESSSLELNPLYPQYINKKSYIKAGLIVLPLFILGFLPLIFQYTPIPDMIGIQKDYSFAEIGLGFGALAEMNMFDFVEVDNKIVGPMGVVAVLLSLLIPLSVFLFFSLSYKYRSQELIKSRDASKQLEKEFNNSLFHLGNRLGDGIPAELAFSKVAESSRGQVTEDFFRLVNSNIQSLGMSVERAIFDNKRGAIIYYPSNLISTSMHILVQSVKKGLKVAAQSLMSISDYVKNINKISDRLKDLLADVVSDMKSTMTFLAPLLAGIVVGLGTMIILILSRLTSLISEIPGGADAAGTIGTITGFFDIGGMLPPYYLQLFVGIFIVEVVFILTKALVTVDSGEDRLKETYDISKNLMRAGWLYIIISLLAILFLSILAAVALAGVVVS